MRRSPDRTRRNRDRAVVRDIFGERTVSVFTSVLLTL